MKNIIYITVLLFSSIQLSLSQACVVSVTPMDTTICPGDTVNISALASLNAAGQYFDFNAGVLPPGWSVNGSTLFTSPCGASPSGTPYYWASTSGGTPGITTAAFDITCGGTISFNMLYAVQGGGVPCEGPDLANEGVELQYSLDGGLTWITIIYYSPGGYTLPSNPGTSGSVAGVGGTPYTVWNTFNVPIPPGALSISTMFRWTQEWSSGTCCDNWGLEDISINSSGSPCGSAIVNWSNGLMDTTSFYTVPAGDTAFVAYVYDTLGVFQCQSDTIFITMATNDLAYTLVDFTGVNCPMDSALVDLLNLTGGQAPITFDWSNGSTISSSYLNTNGTFPDTITYYVDVTDGCGYVVSDSVDLYVSQTLQIDSLTMQPQINCDPTGAAQAYVSGNISPLAHSWTGPGNPGVYNSSTSSISNVPLGWYYYTATDGGCSVSDSIYIDSVMINNVTYDLVDYAYVYCPLASTAVEVLNIANAVAPVSITWSTGSVTNPTFLVADVNPQDSITYYVDIVDGCGFAFYDSVVLVVNQILTVDAVTQSESAACSPTGVATAQVSGVTGSPTYEWADTLFHINDPLGNSSPTIQWQNIGSGWYYFTVTDAVCEASDSIFVEAENPPIANFSATPDNGCAPVDVVFSNYSQNTYTYEWDFGNGNVVNVNNSGNQYETFTETSTVTLTAYTTQNCASSTSITIQVIPCGCTDPNALNYNPIATIEDGSCIYPDPIIIAPNIFTPNGDGSNDLFEFDVSNYTNLEVIITNRWGNLMFEQSGINPAWTGLSQSGNPANEGTYFYQYVVTGMDNVTQIKGHGFVQLVRD